MRERERERRFTTYLDSFVHESSSTTRRPEMRVFLCTCHLYIQHTSPGVIELLMNWIYFLRVRVFNYYHRRYIWSALYRGKYEGKNKTAELGTY